MTPKTLSNGIKEVLLCQGETEQGQQELVQEPEWAAAVVDKVGDGWAETVRVPGRPGTVCVRSAANACRTEWVRLVMK